MPSRKRTRQSRYLLIWSRHRAAGWIPTSRPRPLYFQVPRVAKVRSLPEARVRQLVNEHIQERFLGILGEARVNVLQLNIALDGLSAG